MGHLIVGAIRCDVWTEINSEIKANRGGDSM